MLRIFKRKKKERVEKTIEEDYRNRVILELSKFLMWKFHFNQEEALEASKDFWKKWEKKIKEVIG